MSAAPKVVIGIPLYNGAEHLAEAIESLLCQTYAEFDLVLADDCSEDETSDIVAAYADDKRIHYHRNDRRLGLVGNWRRAFELANELRPGLDYFAWGSDHDAWHPRWLEALLPELEEHPEAVLAYPRIAAMLESGATRRRPVPSFATAGVGDPVERAELTHRHGAFGSRVYGLFRAETVARCGIFRYVFLPDRLLLVEAAAHGQFREVPEFLWLRRLTGNPSVERQREAFFPGRRVPLTFRAPWPRAHRAILFWSLAVRGRARPAAGRRQGAAVARTCRQYEHELAPAEPDGANEEVERKTVSELET